MACDNQIGVKNVMLTFRDCDTDEVYGPISHELATEDLPTWRLCPYNNEPMPGGFVNRQHSNSSAEINVIRDLRIPLALYQGCADVTLQVEYFNGLVYSGVNGTGTGDEMSDTHAVTMTLVFRTIDELLPAGTLEANPPLAA
jgi:hypothetical protein